MRDQRAGPLIRRCNYNFGYVARLYRQDFTIVFRVARTGRPVGRIQLSGGSAACQDAVTSNDDDTVDHQYSGLTKPQADATFSPYARAHPADPGRPASGTATGD